MNIREVTNGYVVDYNGRQYVATSLYQAAQIVGEPAPSNTGIKYAAGESRNTLAGALRSAQVSKIDGIKELREVFTPRLGLREAKDLVELFLEALHQQPPKKEW